MGVKKRETRDELMNWIASEFNAYDYLVCLDILGCNSSDNSLKNRADRELCHEVWVNTHEPDSPSGYSDFELAPSMSDFEHLLESLSTEGLRQFKSVIADFRMKVVANNDPDDVFRYNFNRLYFDKGLESPNKYNISKLDDPRYVSYYFNMPGESRLISYPDAEVMVPLEYIKGDRSVGMFGVVPDKESLYCKHCFRIVESPLKKELHLDILRLDLQLCKDFLGSCKEIIPLLESYDRYNSFESEVHCFEGYKIVFKKSIDRYTEKPIIAILDAVGKDSDGEAVARKLVRQLDGWLMHKVIEYGLRNGEIKFDTLLDLDRNLVRKKVASSKTKKYLRFHN